MGQSSRSAVAAASVELICPPQGASALADAIRTRGHVPLSVGGMTLMELPMASVTASWKSAARLPAQRVAALSWQLAEEIAGDDEPEIHGAEAAALFLLALRHHHANLQRALGGCRIRWNGHATDERVEYLT
jgi:hypothetical protein